MILKNYQIKSIFFPALIIEVGKDEYNDFNIIFNRIIWYSDIFFGKKWFKSTFKTSSNYKNLNEGKNVLITFINIVISWAIFNLLLIFLINNIFAPIRYDEIILFSFILVAINALIEFPHIEFEIRSYKTFVINIAFNFVATTMSILL
ncbi:hypothetical protein BpHYR1_008772 [Brachionus plicatilis]|uniref:Uncharacterized protein n=1 Tax=Brachionus plicatilis TaxID=10195 RepID=A0A3M7PBP9_BRAPC|nr:hypothetical protein BpHYR1_008772 [Brachionus plicatilis]